MRPNNVMATLLVVVSAITNGYGQDGLQTLLLAIDSNNTTLQAIRAATDATKMANLTGLNPENPQVQVNYLNISPGVTRMRRDVNVTQTIDFPTAYGHRRSIAKSANEKAELVLASRRVDIHYEASQTYVNWIHTKQVAEQFGYRVSVARQLLEGYERAFQAGEISVLERNKAKINTINVTKAAELNAVEQAARYAELVRLNGGSPLPSVSVDYPDYSVPLDFEVWLASTLPHNSELAGMDQDIAVGRAQQRLSKALALPALTGGYMYEEDIDARFSGVTLGLSIPLWQQKNTVKQTKLQTRAYEQAKLDARTQFSNEQKRLYQRAQQLSAVFTELQELTQDTSGEQLLKRALELGELSLLDYLVELTMYYEAIDRRMEAERDLHLALIELYKWEK